MRKIIRQAAAVCGRVARAGRPLLTIAGLVPLLLFGGFAWFDYTAESDRAREHVAETTVAMAEHAQKVVETADLVLARVLDHVQGKDWATIAQSREVHDFLAGLKDALPQVESVFLVSPEGLNAASSRGFPLPPLSDTSRDYFAAARQGNRGLFVSAPFKGQIAGTYAFTITRPRLNNGRFDGLAGVTVSPEYFITFYKAALEHPGGSATALVREDGTPLLRFPDSGQPLARLAPTSPTMAAASSGAAFAMFTGRSTLDGRVRLAAFKRLEGVPLLVSYAISRNTYLRGWYRNLVCFGLLAAVLSATILLAGRALLAEASREHDALARLVEETQRRREAEAALQQAQKMEALGRLTGGVAHDFNNLLTAILGSLELLQKHVSEPRPSRLIATARQAAQRGAQLTAHMLAFSRKQEVAARPTDVNATIAGMTELISRATGPTVRVRHQLSADLRPAVADPGQLEIALLNLAVNARDAMVHGGDLTVATDHVTIATGRAGGTGLASGEYVRISVTDTGQGMSEAVRARAFEPFFTTKGPGIGTGLGLSMVFGFASQMGGTVTLESTPGVGTTVRIFLPRAKPEADAEVAAAALAAAGAPPTVPSARILLVDDDQSVRTTTRRMLEEMELVVVEAASGAAALAVLAADRLFDLVIIDFAMPEMNGAQCASAIRALWPEAPLLFITGYVENDDLRPWTGVGVPTLGKPFSQEVLAAAMAEALRKAQASARVIPFRAQRG